MTTADSPRTDRKTAHLRDRITLGSGSLIALVLLLAAVAATTTYRSDSEDKASGKPAFDAAKYAAGTYGPKVVPALEKNAVDIATLHKAISADPEAAGKKYGHRPGTGPYSYAVTVTGTAGAAENGLLRLTVPGLAKTRVSVQVGPAINGTALRDAAGFIAFGQFTNQVEYADAATALNTAMKDKVLKAFDPAAVRGKQVTVVGAMTPLTADVLTLTPVSIEAAS
ncbi:DUF2291 domain-containing protein [Streptomyces sp. NPDC047070]|uniref:DUF2291 family protein n=1 Tax=Streptomyces sp. NPDC047070 TaxID=3154923 RepID=UPI003455D788